MSLFEMSIDTVLRRVRKGIEPALDDKIFEAIYEQARRLMNTSNLYIVLYDVASDTVRFGLVLLSISGGAA